ncbi:hypothetical protein DAPPUDRAFT_260926 [Daphnia pulex]|uniref:Uncharacterized protein n=1 Tax=Daphnia pulex TaxID=6669 RepID=E9HK43_DAPPU|nr:hypothetical protein DAPPUDRAFT_260926 [Daphnia pulex]|eukprot:EFX67896.1 hypothetical protein DAPPUDRAFT_260926 [Daphnia pulex]
MVGLGTNGTTTADEEKAIEILQKVKTKLADNNMKRYDLLQFLVCRIGNILGLFCEPAAVQELNRRQGTETTTSAVAMVTPSVGISSGGGAFERSLPVLNC